MPRYRTNRIPGGEPSGARPSRQAETHRLHSYVSRLEHPPFSFQQLTSTQSPISPLNPVFPPFVGIKMRISLPSNSITTYQYPGKRVPTRFYEVGSAPRENRRRRVLWIRIREARQVSA